MSISTEDKRPWKERIRDPYRLVVLNDETLQEVSNYKLNLLNLYILASTLVLIVGLVVYALIIYTPLKRTIPGYGDISSTPGFIELKDKTKELEKEIIALQSYIEANRNRLLGNPNSSVASNVLEQAYLPQEVEVIEPKTEEKQVEEVIDQKLQFFYPPLQGEIFSQFEQERNHFGVDILGVKNSAIAAISAGTVISSEYNLETGNTISIQHADNIISTYKHNSKLLKEVGDFVRVGEAIAIIGNTGERSNGYHLHFELWMDGESVDPVNYIDFSK